MDTSVSLLGRLRAGAAMLDHAVKDHEACWRLAVGCEAGPWHRAPLAAPGRFIFRAESTCFSRLVP
jgi:hypothetical protein